MSLQDFLDTQGSKSGKTNGGSNNSTVIDFSNIQKQLSEDPKKSLMNWGGQLFDSISKNANDGYTLLQDQTKSAATIAGKTVGVVNEDGTTTMPSLFAQSEEDPILKHMSKKQRILGFLICIFGGLFCFSFAAALLPVLVVSSRKFALLFTMGSLFFIISFSLLKGPVVHLKSLATPEKLPFTCAYFGSLVLTLYTAMVLQSYFLTVFSSLMQCAALLYFFMSYIPGGVKSLTFMCKTMGNICMRMFPI